MYDPDDVFGPYVVLGLVVIHDDADNAAQLNMARNLVRSVAAEEGDLIQFRSLAQPHHVTVHHIVPRGATADTSVVNGTTTRYATDESPVRFINRGWKRIMDRGASKTAVVFDFAGLIESTLLSAYTAIGPTQLVSTLSWGIALTTEAAKIIGLLDEALPAPQAAQEFETRGMA